MKFFPQEQQPYQELFHRAMELKSCMARKSLGFEEYNGQPNIQV
jgi:hypothetical protein